MNPESNSIATQEQFVARHMGAEPDNVAWQPDKIQVYPLSIAAARLRTPTPLFRAEYSFLLLLLAGGGRQQIDSELVDLQANDVLFVREGHLNAIKSIEPGTSGYFIHIESSLLPQVFADAALLHRLTFYPRHSVSGAEMAWLCRCCDLMLLPETGNPAEIRLALLKAVVLKLADASATARCKPDRQLHVTIAFKELLYDKFIRHREVGFYADALAVSENYLNRCVRAVTGRSPKQHVNETLVAHSKVLLQDAARDIAQVAFELNFSDPSYFGRLFKQLTKQTPTDYRNAFLQGLSG